MSRTALLLCLVPVLASADTNEKFAHLREGAETLNGLSGFLEKYIGECEGAGPECKANASAFRREANGKRFFMIVPEDSASIAPGSYDASSEQMTLNITPFFPAGGYALTQGAPHKTDAAGNPVMPFLYVKAKLPDGMSADSMGRLIGMRGLRLQVVFTPQDVWTLGGKRDKGGKMYGVRARIDGLLVTVGRTGEELAFYSGR